MLYTSQPRPTTTQRSPSMATPALDRDRSASIAHEPDERKPDPSESGINGNGDEEHDGDDEVSAVAPTTRSKTAPFRKPVTPPLQTPGPEVRERTLTLSDVLTARDVLAEKANAHWMKGLGGGQNKEGETIVNFLYKMKVGPGEFTFISPLYIVGTTLASGLMHSGRLLRVYNPAYPAYGNHAQ